MDSTTLPVNKSDPFEWQDDPFAIQDFVTLGFLGGIASVSWQ